MVIIFGKHCQLFHLSRVFRSSLMCFLIFELLFWFTLTEKHEKQAFLYSNFYRRIVQSLIIFDSCCSMNCFGLLVFVLWACFFSMKSSALQENIPQKFFSEDFRLSRIAVQSVYETAVEVNAITCCVVYPVVLKVLSFLAFNLSIEILYFSVIVFKTARQRIFCRN